MTDSAAASSISTGLGERGLWWRRALALVLALTAFRLVLLFLSPLELFGDEAQYWTWSRELAFGYFTKPPMIAWVIRASTEVCGNGVACIRLPSALIHAGTALILFALAARMFDARHGFWAAAGWITLPGVAVSAGLASTDVPLLFFWSLGLLLVWRSREAAGLGARIALGAVLGLGLLSKYAMAYFFLWWALAALFDPAIRRAALSRFGLAALLVALLAQAPNLAWNLGNGMATYGHLGDNAHWQGSLFHPGKAAEFLGGQLGVFGPVLFVAYVLALWRLFRRAPRPAEARFLAAFSLPVLLLILGQAFLSRAFANWAATAYPAALLLAVAWLLSLAGRGRFWLRLSLALHLFVAVAAPVVAALPPALWLPKGADPFTRLRGWSAIGTAVEARLAERPDALLLFEDRMLMASLIYELRDRPTAMRIWNPDGRAANHYELTASFIPAEAAERPVLLITRNPAPGHLFARFARHAPAGEVDALIGRERRRETHLFWLEEPKEAGR